MPLINSMINILKLIINNLCNKKAKILFPSFIGNGVIFKGNNFVGRFSHLKHTIIGRYTYLGNGCDFSNCVIGSFCSISSNVKLILGSHPSSRWVSTHPLFFSKNSYVGKGFVDEIRFEEFKNTSNGYSCEIGNDVWIGSNVSILQGVTIGDGAIVGANSLVTKDIPPYTIVVGCPAHFIRNRFCEDDIDLLNKIKWWNWDIEKIRENALYFENIEELKKHI